MRLLRLFLFLLPVLIASLAACQPAIHPLPKLPPPVATTTSFPTPAGSFSADDLATRIALREQIQPEAGAVALNRVEALIQTYEFVEFYTSSMADTAISLEELAVLIQLAANARASLYSTGQPDMIQFANTAGQLTDLAIHGDWEMAESALRKFQRSLPRKPSVD